MWTVSYFSGGPVPAGIARIRSLMRTWQLLYLVEEIDFVDKKE
jgi:hypothetical protein